MKVKIKYPYIAYQELEVDVNLTGNGRERDDVEAISKIIKNTAHNQNLPEPHECEIALMNEKVIWENCD